jgi:hypothetical protein
VSQGTSVFVAVNGGGFDLIAFSLSSGGTQTLVPGAHAKALATSYGGDTLYFAAEGIYRVPVSGGAPTLLAVGLVPDECHVPVLAADGLFVYWVDRDTNQVMYVAN